jgi:hypothetical protein
VAHGFEATSAQFGFLHAMASNGCFNQINQGLTKTLD